MSIGNSKSNLESSSINTLLATGNPAGGLVPQTVFKSPIFNLNATDGVAHENLFIPLVTGRYMLTTFVTTHATDASGATTVARNTANNNQGCGANTAAVGLTILGKTEGTIAAPMVHNLTALSAQGFGFIFTVTGVPAGGSWDVQFMVEYLGP